MIGQAVERLYLLTVDATQANRQLQQINKNTSAIAGAFSGIQRAAAAAFSVVAIARATTEMVKAEDQINMLAGSFEALTGSSDLAADMMERVFRTVNNTGASLEDTSSTFQRLTIGLRELGGTNEQVEAVANSFIKLGRISGTSMFNTNAALVQFSQGLASGKLQGDELRSIMERLPLITQLIADEWNEVNGGIKVTRGDVKEMGRDGQLSAHLIANAMLRTTEEIEEAFKKLPFTLEQELNRMKSNFTQFMAVLSEESGFGDATRAGVRQLSDTFEDLHRNLKQFSSDMSLLFQWSKELEGAILLLSVALAIHLEAAIAKVSIALYNFAKLHKGALAIGLIATAIILWLKEWDKIRIFFIHELPSLLNTALGHIYTFVNDVSLAFQVKLPSVQNFFKDLANKAIEIANVKRLAAGEDPLPLWDLTEATEGVSKFGKMAADAFGLAADQTLAYGKALAALAEEEQKRLKGDLFPDLPKIDDEAVKAAKEYREGLIALRDRVLSTIDPLHELKLVLIDLQVLVAEGVLDQEQVDAFIAIASGADKAAEELEKAEQGWRDYAQSVRDAIDPMNAMLREFTKMDIAVEMGELSKEAAERRKAQLYELSQQADKSTDIIVNALKEIKDATNGFAREFTDTLVEGLKEGEFAFKDFAASILETMAKIVLNSIFEKFFAMLLTSMNFDGWGTSSGGGYSGPSGPPQRSSAGTFISEGDSDSTVGVMKAPTYGRGAGAGAAKGLVTVNINNHAPVDVSTSTSTNSQGGVSIDLLIEQKVNKSLSTGGFDKAMKNNYGVSRRAF